MATIRKWHKARGWKDIGYHKVVYLDGSVHGGRPMNKKGAHVKARNKGTLGYCYIGGVAKDGKTPKDTRTLAQKVTMARLTREAIEDFGVTKVSGHNQYAAKACPSFYVPTDSTIQKAVKGKKVVVKPVKPAPRLVPGKKRTMAWFAPILFVLFAAIAAFLKLKGVW